MTIDTAPRVIPAPGAPWAKGLKTTVPVPLHKMDPVLKSRWVGTLLSGNLEQVEGTLRAFVNRSRREGKVGYCCIGVLCNLKSNRHDWKRSGAEFGWRGFPANATDELAVIPGFPDKEILDFLAELNDDHYTFVEIGVWIEKYL